MIKLLISFQIASKYAYFFSNPHTQNQMLHLQQQVLGNIHFTRKFKFEKEKKGFY